MTTSNLILEETDEEIRQSIDFEINVDKIKIHLRKLKDKKASKEGEILKEILKSSNKGLSEVYRSLLNPVILTEKYQQELGTTLTRLIH